MSLQCPSIDINAKFFVCALDLHSVNMNGDSRIFDLNFTYSGKNRGECGKITVLTLSLCRVNDMVNKIYFDFQTSCRKISCSCIDFARGTIPTHSDRAITLYRGRDFGPRPRYRYCTKPGPCPTLTCVFHSVLWNMTKICYLFHFKQHWNQLKWCFHLMWSTAYFCRQPQTSFV